MITPTTCTNISGFTAPITCVASGTGGPGGTNNILKLSIASLPANRPAGEISFKINYLKNPSAYMDTKSFFVRTSFTDTGSGTLYAMEEKIIDIIATIHCTDPCLECTSIATECTKCDPNNVKQFLV